MTSPDLLVIGGGSAGLSAARTARALNRSVAIVNDGPPGGDCTFTGCVPSKTLLSAGSLTFTDAMARVRATIASIAADEDVAALTDEGIDVVLGRAVVQSPNRVEVHGTVLRPRKILIATGARPQIPLIPGLSEIPYLTTDTLFDLEVLPDHLVIVGVGPIGVEMAAAFRQFGANVTTIEAADRLIGREEPRASRVITQVLRRSGVTVKTSTAASSVSLTDDDIQLTLAEDTLSASHLLIATGRQPNLSRLDALGLALTDQKAIRTNLKMQTSDSSIYAAGDVTGRSAFT
ncbi:MAG: FAD-dependent oxidoreductase, partial [Actinobacteria bacterium]|nr:FAD-dependent oxidoreductase [Actinomycetota bacterium]